MSEGASATFHDMSESTQEDWNAIMTHNIPCSRNGGKRVLDHLKLLNGDFGGFARGIHVGEMALQQEFACTEYARVVVYDEDVGWVHGRVSFWVKTSIMSNPAQIKWIFSFRRSF